VADQAETPKILDEISKNTNVKPQNRVDRKKRTARRRAFGVMVVVLLIGLGLGALGWQQYRVDQRMSAVVTLNESLSARVASYDAQISSLQEQLQQQPEIEIPQIPEDLEQQLANAASVQDLNSIETTLATEISRLNRVVAALESREVASITVDTSTFQIAEAEYLLRMANRRLQLQGDVDAAIRLMEDADQTLLGASETGSFAVRQAIGEEVLALRSVADIDLDGLQLRLQNLSAQIDSLQVQDSMRQRFLAQAEDLLGTSSENGAASQEAPSQVQQGMLQTAGDILSKVFVFRDLRESTDASFTPGNETEIKQGLKLSLERGQLALLTRNQQQYDNAVAAAMQQLEQYFDTTSELGQVVATELAALQIETIAPLLPDVSASLALIQQLTLDQ